MTLTPLLLHLVACGHHSDDSSGTSDEAACGDIDGPGNDTGDVPNLLGVWTSSFAQAFYDDGTCAVANLTQTSETWISAFEVVGSPSSSFYLTYNDRDDERFWGAIDPFGGVTYTGLHHHAEGTMYAQFGGLLYHDQYIDRDVIDGAAFLGLDVDGDAVIDCGVKGSWKATKSGV
jgi:hypothetical protein